MLYSGEPKKRVGHILVILRCITTNVKRIVTDEDCLGLHRTSKVRVSTTRNYYHFKDLVVVSSSNWWTSCES